MKKKTVGAWGWFVWVGLGAGAHCATTRPAPGAVRWTEACATRLRGALRASLEETLEPIAPPAGGWTLSTLDERWTQDSNGYHFAVLALSLPNPTDALPLLRARLGHDNRLTALESAAVLSLLGDRTGVARLRSVETLTQSGVEFFYARAGLLLLGEPIPDALARAHIAIPALGSELSCP